jgi:peptidoglycan/LPS O-acetylase OafA/YrhL
MDAPLRSMPAASPSANPAAIRSEAAPSTPASGRRLEFLDALRGIAATYVVLYHLANIPSPHLAVPVWAERVVGAGGTGVTLFFVVSAFSLFYTMPLRRRDQSPTRSFYVHRFFRIAPLFYLWIVLTLGRDTWLLGVHHAPLAIAASIAFVFNLLPGRQQGFVWAGWTIGVEMIFYLVFPLVYRVVRGVPGALMLALGCWLAWLAYGWAAPRLPFPAFAAVATEWLFLRHFPMFAIGAVCYFVWRDGGSTSLPEPGRRRRGAFLIAIALLLYVGLLSGRLQALPLDPYYWQGPMYGCLLVGLALRPTSVLVNRLTRFLGTISYSVYLNHPTLVLLLTPLYRRLYLHAPSVGVGFASSVALTFALLLPISWVTYRCVEEPGVRLGRRLIATVPRPRVGDSAREVGAASLGQIS